MTSLTERLKFIVDLDVKGAIQGFGDVEKSADKHLTAAAGKLDKIGGSLTKFGAGALAASGIAGAALFGAASKFADLGIAAGKFSDTTGLAIEDASKWIEVAGDMGIEAGTLEGSLNKMNIAADKTPEKFAKFGVEIIKTKDGATDVNATFLNVIDRLNGIADPAEKARVASELLGKGWTGMSELIATGSDTLKASLDSVSEAKIISPEEEQKAKDLRAGMDALKDSVENLVLTIGSALAPAFSTIATTIGGVVDGFNDLNDASGGLLGKIAGVGVAALGAVGGLALITGQVIKLRTAIKDPDGSVNKLVSGLKNLPPAAGAAAVAVGAVVAGFLAYKKAAEQAEERTAELAESAAKFATVADDALGKTFAAHMGQLALDVVLSGKSMEAEFDALAETSLLGAKRMLEYGEANGLNAESMDLLREAIERKEDADADAARAADRLADSQGKANDAAKDGADYVTTLDRSQRDFAEAASDAEQATKDWQARLEEGKANVDAIERKQDLWNQALEISNDKLEDQKQALEDEKKALEEATQALEDQIDAQRSAADAQFALSDATDTYNGFLAGLREALKEAKGDQSAVNALYREGTLNTAALADATVRAYDEQSLANGVTLSAVEKLGIWNQKMLDAVKTQDGPLKQSTIDYIARVNGVPAERATEFTAAVNAGDIATVNAILDGASKDRTVVLKVALDAASKAAALAAIPGGSVYIPPGKELGGPVRAGQPYIVGEKRPELFVPDTNGTILPSVPAAGVGFGGNTYIDNSVHNYPPGVTDQSFANARRNEARRRLT